MKASMQKQGLDLLYGSDILWHVEVTLHGYRYIR